MQKLILNIKGMRDKQSEVQIVDKLKTLDGVLLVRIYADKAFGVIMFDESRVVPKAIVAAIHSLGFTTASALDGSTRKHCVLLVALCVLALLVVCCVVMFSVSSVREVLLNLIRWGIQPAAG